MMLSICMINIFMGLYTYIIKKTHPVFFGINYWITSNLFIGLGYLFVALRGVIPNVISILFSNDLFAFAGFIRIVGLNNFFNKQMHSKKVIAFLLAIAFYTVVIGFFTYYIDSIYIRVIIAGFFLSFLSIYTGILIINNAPAKAKKVYYFTSCTFFAFAFVFLLRVVGWILFPSIREMFISVFFNSVQFGSSMVIDIAWTTMFFVIYNQRLTYKLIESEEKFRIIFEKNTSAIAILELDTSISMVNEEYTRLSGYSNEEIIGHSWAKYIVAEDLPRLHEYYQNRLNNIEAPEKYEFSFYKKTGEKMYAIMSVAVVPGIKQIISSITNITERKKAELQLQQMMVLKDRELALSAISLAQNTELNTMFISKLNMLKQSNKGNIEQLSIISDLISDVSKNQQNYNWENFVNQFTLIYPNYINAILTVHPELTSSDIKLCTLLRLHISTKDIANITNLTYDSIRVFRTRLRKKLKLGSDEGLVAYLMQFK